MYDLAELVKTIYATPLSSELAMKFFDGHSTLHYSIVQLPREKTCSKLPALPEVPFRYFLVN